MHAEKRPSISRHAQLPSSEQMAGTQPLHVCAELLCTLRQVTRENMAEAIDLFTRALDADLILPSDF